VHHGFTHYRLLMHPRAWRGIVLRDAAGENVGDNAGDAAPLRWVSRAEFDALGIPAPIRTLITRQHS
jgi:A/G-specific adenine glycosylase